MIDEDAMAVAARSEYAAAAAFRPPPFDRTRADRYFREAEGQFITLGITTAALKLSCVAGAVHPEVMAALEDEMDTYRADANPYQVYKEAVLQLCRLPEWVRMKSLLALPKIGPGLGPLSLWLRMKTLMAEAHSEAIRGLFMVRLPLNLYQKYRTREWPENPINLIMEMDRDWDQEAGASKSAAGLNRVAEDSDSDEEEVAALDDKKKKQKKKPTFTKKKKKKGDATDSEDDKEGWCRYHRKFGSKANYCSKDCTYHKKGGSSAPSNLGTGPSRS